MVLPVGSVALGRRSMAQSHGRCGGSLVAACLLKANIPHPGMPGTRRGSLELFEIRDFKYWWNKSLGEKGEPVEWELPLSSFDERTHSIG